MLDGPLTPYNEAAAAAGALRLAFPTDGGGFELGAHERGMSSAFPRLLVGIPSTDDARSAIDRALPAVPWAFADAQPPPSRDQVEAILAGPLDRGSLATFDPATTPRLRFVQRLATGLDGFPFDRFPPTVAVAGNVGGYAPFVAEHAVTIALAAARDLNSARDKVRAGVLRPPPEERTFLNAEISILGFGAIGAEIARRLRPFGVRVLGVSRTGAASPDADRVLSAERFRDALPGALAIFEVRPLTAMTRRTIGATELTSMREDAILVNVGRADTVDPDALYDHLRSHPRFRAAFDVWWEEDFRNGRIGGAERFAALPNFLGTPHCATAFPAAEGPALATALENLARYFRDGQPEFVADRAEYKRAPRPSP